MVFRRTHREWPELLHNRPILFWPWVWVQYGSMFTYGRIDDFILYGEGGTRIIDTVTACGMSTSGTFSATSYRDMTGLPPAELIADS